MAVFVREHSFVTVCEYSHDFRLIGDDTGSGYTFPVNQKGEVDLERLPECAQKSYVYCLAHPDKFEDIGVVKTERTVVDHGAVRCHCGEVVDLEDRYLGACSCPKCGQWYNLFGQELKSPEYWEDEIDA